MEVVFVSHVMEVVTALHVVVKVVRQNNKNYPHKEIIGASHVIFEIIRVGEAGHVKMQNDAITFHVLL